VTSEGSELQTDGAEHRKARFLNSVLMRKKTKHLLCIRSVLVLVCYLFNSCCVLPLCCSAAPVRLKKSTHYTVLTCRSTAAKNEEEKNLLLCLRKSVMSPYRKQIISLPLGSTAEAGTSSASSKAEVHPFTSPKLPSRPKSRPHNDSTSSTWLSPRRAAPSKHAVGDHHKSTPPRRTKQHFHDGKKTVLMPRRTPGKRRSQTPRKSARRTPAKSEASCL